MLAGYLKDKGIGVIQADYNMGYLDYWRRKVLADGALQGMTTLESSVLIRELLNEVFDKKSKRDYYYSAFLSQDSMVSYGMRCNSSFHFTERILSSDHLLRYVEDAKENTFLQFFLDTGVVSRIAQDKIGLVGISIIAPSQAVAAFTLGRLIKNNLPCVHVVIGGQWVSLYQNQLMERPAFKDFFDSMIVFEGEEPLYQLILSLKEKRGFESVPNLIFYSGGHWVSSERMTRAGLNEIACPDFDGLPLDRYVVAQQKNQIALTYQTSRECSWNKCVYCVDLPLPKFGYRERDVDLIIGDIKRLTQRYKMSFLEISNAAISPSQMKRLSDRIIREGLDFSWWCFARLEPGFTLEVLRLAKRAGCQNVVYGLESANQRVLDHIRKGIHIEIAKRVIADTHESGIKVDLQMMMGLPSETVEEALDTVQFLIDQRRHISSATFNTYYLTPACEVYLNPHLYGIDYRKDPNLPFKFFHEFSHTQEGVSRQKADQLISLYWELLNNREERAVPPPASSEDYSGTEDYALSLTVGDDTAGFLYRFDKGKKEGAILAPEEEKTNV
jgi:radical SAM superfamily enzyme YgiQ (UPF0313 family)